MEVIGNNSKAKNNQASLVVTESLILGSWIWYSVEDRLLFSERFCRMAGISKNSYYNFKTFFDIIHGDDLLQFMDSIQEMLHGSSSHWIYFRIVRPNNSIQKINCFMESMTTEFEEVFDITGVCFDLNE